MREVKEKSPLKEHVGETLKSAPQAVFRRGADVSFQQLRQELRDAAQDGQPEDRYESDKITDTADHAVWQARHLAEKAIRKLPKTKPESPHPKSSTKKPSAAPKSDTTQFALPEIKTKAYIRKKRQKQHLLREEASSIGSAAADSETFLPVIRTREAVREQREFRVSYSADKPAAPQAAARQAVLESVPGESERWQPTSKHEVVSAPASRTAAPEKAVHFQKQLRPAFVGKQKVKTAPKMKIKTASSKASAETATIIRKGQALRDTAIKTAKAAKEAGKKVLQAMAAAAEKLAAAIGAGGAAAVSVVVVILLVGMLFASPLGILFAGEDTGTEIKIPDAVATLNGEFTEEIYRIMEDHPYDELDMQEGMEAAMLQNWRNVLAVYAVKVSTDEEHGLDVMTMDEEKLQLLREVFFDANKLEYELTTRTVDGERITTLHISVQIKNAMQMADEYGFTDQQREMLEELLKPDYDDIFLSLIGNYQPGSTPIGPVDISDIQGTLPDDLDPLRESIVLTAYQLLGKVTYFWGGKSLVLGRDSRWGTPTTVTAPGSGSTGKVIPFGLDCSGFVDWTFYNATNGAYLPGRGGGAASQHGYCTNIAWADALPGDLVFYADDSHVGIVCGYDSVGNILVVHCSGGQNGVVVTGREGFAVVARPDLFIS